jgi:hypothetical protein
MITEIKEVKKDGKRCLQVTAEIMDEPTKITEKGNGTVVSLGGNRATNIMAGNGQPITVGLFGYAQYND